MLGPAEPHDYLTFSGSPVAWGQGRELESDSKPGRLRFRVRLGRLLFRTLAVSLLLAGLILALGSAFATSHATPPDPF